MSRQKSVEKRTFQFWQFSGRIAGFERNSSSSFDTFARKFLNPTSPWQEKERSR